jgi:starch synthase
MRQELVDLGVKSNKIRYLPNAVDTDIFRPLGNKASNLILFVGRVTFGKGLHVLLESLKYIKTETHLVIIGPPDYDVEYFLEMKNIMNAENRKGFHTITYLGALDETNIIKWYQKASLLVLPSFREASSVVSLEASSCGTPVVATDVGGVPEVVHDGENGILVPPNNAQRLAKAIQYFLDNEDERIRFGIRGRTLAVKRFSYYLAIRNLCEIYKELS